MPIVKICELCGKEFKVPPSDAKQRFCSADCGNKSRRIVTEYVCEVCGKTFQKKGSRKDGVKYCSHKCSFVGLQNRITRHCDECGKDVTRPVSQNETDLVFCSAKCYGEYRSKHYRGENHPRYNSIKKICAVCGKPFTIPYSVDIYKNVNCCSWECRLEYIKTHPLSKEPNEERQYLKEQKLVALERDGYKCQNCGAVDRLEVHHVKKRRSFGGNWLEAHKADNLITYCNTCHLSLEPRRMIPESEYRANLSDSDKADG